MPEGDGGETRRWERGGPGMEAKIGKEALGAGDDLRLKPGGVCRQLRVLPDG